MNKNNKIKSQWSHNKYKTKFVGSYQRFTFVGGEVGIFERIFVLTNGRVTLAFESHQAAKKSGWVKK